MNALLKAEQLPLKNGGFEEVRSFASPFAQDSLDRAILRANEKLKGAKGFHAYVEVRPGEVRSVLVLKQHERFSVAAIADLGGPEKYLLASEVTWVFKPDSGD